ncbi:hypothetical protein [Streptomyces sp. YIM S03343]
MSTAMSAEILIVAAYVLVLLAVVAVLDLYGRQPTSAWASRVFAGYRRAVPEAPEPAHPDDWPHSEVSRFHRVISLAVSGVAVVLTTAELVRHHRTAEAAVLLAVVFPHVLLAARRVRGLRRSVPVPTAGAPSGGPGE